ncbi:branched-chain amino acid ABC transporter permease [Ruegeria sp.]|uniref:branched-chain amino acid ABC transporter permease n=1 Tax=Ruegeria sp. TaxID=1879320 RepID=UPI00230C973F|nr:branched-chain amino acid ABC transporter permease [Ruegeria sp.]MDA7966427.1 branched-chain amino acid ABC transporter permease [Ruegeria sp.]
MTNQTIEWVLRAGLIGFGIYLCALPFVSGLSTTAMATSFLVTLTLAMTFNLLAGYANIILLGQHALVGIGSYGFFATAVLLGVNHWIAVLLAGVAAFLLAIPLIAFILRLRAAYLAVGTWVFAETVTLASGKLSAFNGATGISIPVSLAKAFGARTADRVETIYWMALVLSVVTFISIWVFLRHPSGMALSAMRDNEEAAASIGVNINRARAYSLLCVAPIMGLAGAINTLQRLGVTPTSSFSLIDWTVYPLFAAIIGGIGRIEGPIIGTIVFFAIRTWLADLGAWHFVVLGVVAIAVIYLEPGGILGLIRRYAKVSIVPVAHRMRK